VFTGNGARIIKTPVRSPRANSVAERYAANASTTLIYGEGHLRRILAEYTRRYKEHRPHQSREQRPPLHDPGQAVDMTTPDHAQTSLHVWVPKTLSLCVPRISSVALTSRVALPAVRP
jgi:hypothetical protein